MKYFTPGYHVALQGESDAEMNAADELWEQAVEEYGRRYNAIREQLPTSIRDLQERLDLHDADVLSVGSDGETLVMSVTPEYPKGELLTLIYSLDHPPRIDKAALPMAHVSSHCAWLYDEVDYDDGKFVHRILLSNGWSIDVQFHELRILSVHDLLRDVHSPLARPA